MTTHLSGGLAGASESVIEEIQLRVPLEHYNPLLSRSCPIEDILYHVPIELYITTSHWKVIHQPSGFSPRYTRNIMLCYVTAAWRNYGYRSLVATLANAPNHAPNTPSLNHVARGTCPQRHI